VSLLRRAPQSPEQEDQRRQNRELRSKRYQLAQEARRASRGMKPPEPRRGLYVAGAMAAGAAYSFFGHDWAEGTVTKNHKTVEQMMPVTGHPPQAALFFVLAGVAASSIYWKRRMVTGIIFLLAAAIGLDLPFPKSATDLNYGAFLVPAGYVLWMLVFRMNKEQKDLIAAAQGKGAAGASRRGEASTARSSSSGGGRRAPKLQTKAVTGRPLPARSGRYTPPRAKPLAAQRKAEQAAAARAAQVEEPATGSRLRRRGAALRPAAAEMEAESAPVGASSDRGRNRITRTRVRATPPGN